MRLLVADDLQRLPGAGAAGVGQELDLAALLEHDEPGDGGFDRGAGCHDAICKQSEFS